MEARGGEAFAREARGVVRKSPGILREQPPIPAQRDMQLVGMGGTVAENLRGAEEKRAARVAAERDAGETVIGLRLPEPGRGRRRWPEQREAGLIPRPGGEPVADEEGERRPDRRAEVFVAGVG